MAIQTEYYKSAVKKEQTRDACNNTDNLKGTMLSKITQTENTTHCMTPFI